MHDISLGHVFYVHPNIRYSCTAMIQPSSLTVLASAVSQGVTRSDHPQHQQNPLTRPERSDPGRGRTPRRFHVSVWGTFCILVLGHVCTRGGNRHLGTCTGHARCAACHAAIRSLLSATRGTGVRTTYSGVPPLTPGGLLRLYSRACSVTQVAPGAVEGWTRGVHCERRAIPRGKKTTAACVEPPPACHTAIATTATTTPM